MTLETFFEKFDLFADASDAVPKMRGLVLDLAMQGKLAAQSPADINAAELLSAIFAERNRQAPKLRIPSCFVLAKENESPFRIPTNWVWTCLGNIALQIQYGYTASADPNVANVRMLRITDIQDNQVDWPSVPGCQIEMDEAERYLLRPNDILIARTGGTIGKSFIVPDAPIKSVFASYLIRVTPPQSIVARFLKYFLESPFYWRQLRKISAGTGQPNVNGQALGRLEFPLPPLAEQERIVAKVDELMALCDRLESQHQEREARRSALASASLARFAKEPTPTNLEFLFHRSYDIPPAELRRSILTLAIQGKLVAHKSEPLNFPLESILAEASVNGVSKSPVSDSSATEILRISAGTSRGDFYVNENDFKYVDLTPQEAHKFSLAPGDLLACRFNGNLHFVGRFSYYRGESGRIQVNPDKLIRFRIDTDSHCPRYVCYAMNAAPTRRAIESMCATTAGNIGLSAGRLKTISIPLPPLSEQRQIVAKVDELMSLVDMLESQIASVRISATALLEAAVYAVATNSTRKSPSKAIPKPIPNPVKRPNKHFARAVLSAEIVHRLHAEPTFGRVKHQKIFHLCEHIAQITELEGQYHREAAGPLDNRLIYSNEKELKKQKWYQEVKRASYGHAYEPLEKAGNHQRYIEEFWSAELPLISRLIELMRTWDTDRCEIFSTSYAAWNDLLIWGHEATDEAILHEILDRWNPAKQRFARKRWIAALDWMRKEGFVPTGFGKPTAEAS